MRADLMTWVQRLVGLVFVIGLIALSGAVFVQISQSEDIPPLSVFMGLVGLSVLILLAGACLSLISLAGSARRGADALQKLAWQAGGISPAAVASATTTSAASRPFTTAPMADIATQPEPQPQGPVAPSRPLRPSGRRLVAER